MAGREPGPAQRRDQRNFQVDVAALQALNSIEDVSVSRSSMASWVSGGKTIAGVTSRPSSCRSIGCAEAERVAATREGVVRCWRFGQCGVAVLVRERLDPAQREKFQASIEMKVAWFGSSISEIRYVADDVAAVEEASAPATRRRPAADRWRHATDPLARHWSRLGRLDARMEKQGGRPILAVRSGSPTSATNRFLGRRPAACSPRRRSDLILPRLFTGARVTAADFNELGHGVCFPKTWPSAFRPTVPSTTSTADRKKPQCYPKLSNVRLIDNASISGIG